MTGRAFRTIDPINRDHRTFYDALGRTTKTVANYTGSGAISPSTPDQNGTIHEYVYDNLGRLLHDRITTLASGIDNAVLRISTAYDVAGNVKSVTSYNNAAVGSGTIVNEVMYEYDTNGLLSKEFSNPSGGVLVSTPYIGYTYDATFLQAAIGSFWYEWDVKSVDCTSCPVSATVEFRVFNTVGLDSATGHNLPGFVVKALEKMTFRPPLYQTFKWEETLS